MVISSWIEMIRIQDTYSQYQVHRLSKINLPKLRSRVVSNCLWDTKREAYWYTSVWWYSHDFHRDMEQLYMYNGISVANWYEDNRMTFSSRRFIHPVYCGMPRQTPIWISTIKRSSPRRADSDGHMALYPAKLLEQEQWRSLLLMVNELPLIA